MHDLPRQKLHELITEHGHDLCDDAKRLEGMLKDVLRNDHKRETFVLVSAVREGVAQELRATTSDVPFAALAAKLSRQLQDNLALDESAARWSVESWAIALRDVETVATCVGSSTVPASGGGTSSGSQSVQIQNDFEAVCKITQTLGSSKYLMQLVSFDRLSKWQEAAKQGDPLAQWLIGDWTCECNSGRPDFRAAESWWLKSIEGGCTRGCATLGWFFQMGLSVDRGRDAAMDYLRKGASAQDAASIYRLANCHLKGRGIDKDHSSAAKLFERSVGLGYLPAFVSLARCLQRGIGLDKNKSRAVDLIEQAACLGNRNAMYLHGLAGIEDGAKSMDRETATHWLTESAKRGHHGAMTTLEKLGQQSHRVTCINGIGVEFCLLEPGGFYMGTADSRRLGSKSFDDEMPLHPVTLSQPFWISRTPITQEQYRSVTGRNPSGFKGVWPGKWKRQPVETVSWHDAISFCNALSDRDGLVPVYQIHGEDVTWVNGTGYRLPTEAEWEYACRSGSQSDWSWGDDDAEVANFAWCRPHYSGTGGKAVRKLQCNSNGLFDMHGNVWEWCWDYYDQTYYSRSPAVDPIGPDQGEKRVLRGGSWDMLPINCRSAIRVGNRVHEKFDDVGFRIVRSEPRSSTLWLPTVFRDGTVDFQWSELCEGRYLPEMHQPYQEENQSPIRRDVEVETIREDSITAARTVISDDQLLAFFRAIREKCGDDIRAVEIINEDLDRGESLGEIFYTQDECGFELSCERLSDGSYKIAFGWASDADLMGDGGEWVVTFDDVGHVKSAECVERWIM